MTQTMTKLFQHKAWLSVLAVLAMSVILAPNVSAQGTNPDDPFGVGDVEAGPLAITQANDLQQTIGSIINVGLSLLGLVSVIIILIGGGKWMFAGGNDEKVTEARKLIISGVIGLAIIMSAWAIARFVLDSLGEATGIGTGADVNPT